MAAESRAGPPGRLGKMTAANMLRSMLPLVVMVLGLAYFCSPQTQDPVTEIDPSNSIRYAASLTDVVLPVPDLAEAWRPTSVDVTPEGGQPGVVTLTIGYLTPSEEFARYAVSTDSASGLMTDLLTGATGVGALRLGGESWEEFSTGRGEALYLRNDGDLRLVVTGSASQDELRTLAESLTPYRG
ncbi:MAG: DUF4245 domain-containing protein [Geodermatophilaceae bacterium]|nr:DUF4245 domain-containing protein [Geodermatophilaceae bacterium]